VKPPRSTFVILLDLGLDNGDEHESDKLGSGMGNRREVLETMGVYFVMVLWEWESWIPRHIKMNAMKDLAVIFSIEKH